MNLKCNVWLQNHVLGHIYQPNTSLLSGPHKWCPSNLRTVKSFSQFFLGLIFSAQFFDIQHGKTSVSMVKFDMQVYSISGVYQSLKEVYLLFY